MTFRRDGTAGSRIPNDLRSYGPGGPETIMAVIEFTKEDVGKTVVDARGDSVGKIVDTQGGSAYVEPDPGLLDEVKSHLGWRGGMEDNQELLGKYVEEVTADEVRLHGEDARKERTSVRSEADQPDRS